MDFFFLQENIKSDILKTFTVKYESFWLLL